MRPPFPSSEIKNAETRSSLAVLDYVAMASSLSLKTFSRCGSSLTLYGVGRLGNAVSVLDFACMGSALSLRSYGRFGSTLAVFGMCRLGSSIAALDFLNFGSAHTRLHVHPYSSLF